MTSNTHASVDVFVLHGHRMWRIQTSSKVLSSQNTHSGTGCAPCGLSCKRCAHRYRFAEDGSLHISSAQVSDSGPYLCMATNQAGIQRRRVDLQVSGRSHSGYTSSPNDGAVAGGQPESCSFRFSAVPPSIAEGGLDVTVTVNVQASLSCEASGIPKPTVAWMKNGQVINTEQNQNMYRLVEAFSLRLLMQDHFRRRFLFLFLFNQEKKSH